MFQKNAMRWAMMGVAAVVFLVELIFCGITLVCAALVLALDKVAQGACYVTTRLYALLANVCVKGKSYC